MTYDIRPKQFRRSWRLVAGSYVLPGRFCSQVSAADALARNPLFYEFWAGSAGACAANDKRKPRKVSV